MKIDEIDVLRARGVRLMALGGWLVTIVIALAMAAALMPASLPVLMLAVLLNILPTGMALRYRHDLTARLVAGTIAATHPALLVYAMQGDPWQMDMHMYFFVALAALTIMCDWRPIALATGLIALHHLLLDYLAPQWVFTSSGNFGRVLIHALAVLLQLATLAYITHRLRTLLRTQSAAREASEISAREAEAAMHVARAAQAEAERALTLAEQAEARAAAEHARREAVEQAAKLARMQDLLALAAQFEDSVHGIVNSVGASASQLDAAATSLNDLAHDSGRQSADMVLQANQASHAARAVAGSVARLSHSIAGIAASVDQQAELSARARLNSTTGDRAVRSLAGRATDISEFTGRIREIASRTNLLALNATIEAARAGEAGRGFAVVATEVKTLASQAARATTEISALIESVHAGARVAEGSLSDVSDVVDELADAAMGIRTMLTEQRRTAEQLEGNAEQTAQGADHMADRMEQAAAVAKEAGHLSSQVRGAAGELLDHAVTMQEATRTFVERLRA